jgi:hypothetical protein
MNRTESGRYVPMPTSKWPDRQNVDKSLKMSTKSLKMSTKSLKMSTKSLKMSTSSHPTWQPPPGRGEVPLQGLGNSQNKLDFLYKAKLG